MGLEFHLTFFGSFIRYPFICGDSKGNIANPDNVAMMDDFDTLLIGGEDMMSVPSKNVKEEVATEPRNAKRKKKETRTLRNASQDASSKQRKCKSPVPSFTFAKSPTLQNKKTRIRRLDFGDEAKFMSPQSHQSDLMMPKTPGESGRSAKRRRSVASGKCNCKKSKCLKLYVGVCITQRSLMLSLPSIDTASVSQPAVIACLIACARYVVFIFVFLRGGTETGYVVLR